MRISFLGTACAEPTAENGYTSFLLETERMLVLVDASGNPVQSILRAGRDPMEIDAVVLTHYHADHIGGYPSLMQTLGCLGRERPMRVVCSAITRERAQALSDVLDFGPKNVGFEALFQEQLSGESFEIRLSAGRHSVPSSMIEAIDGEARLYYTSDTSYNAEVGKDAAGCRALIHEATFAHSFLGQAGTRGHSSAYQAGLSAKAAGVERLFLCHVCERKHFGEASIVEEARSAFQGEVILPRAFSWYDI